MNIKKETVDRLERSHSIDPQITETLFSIGIITETTARNFCIKDEYEEPEIKYSFRKYKREAIAEKYCCSISKVEKTVY